MLKIYGIFTLHLQEADSTSSFYNCPIVFAMWLEIMDSSSVISLLEKYKVRIITIYLQGSHNSLNPAIAVVP